MFKKEILYVSYDGMTDPLGQSQVLPYIIGLTKADYTFTLVSCEKRERYDQNRSIVEDICRKHSIDWRPIFYTKTPPIISTVWDVVKLNKAVKDIYKEKRFELIHCRSYIPSLIGLAFKKKHGVKFVFDMRGFWADERVDGNLWILSNPIFKFIYTFFKQKEKQFLQHSDKVISLTHAGKKEMLLWNIPELSASKIEVIPCAADYDLFDVITNEKRTNAKAKLEIKENEFVLSYIGSLGTWYLLEEMLLFFSVLKREYPSAKFLFITPESKETVLNQAKKIGLKTEDFIVQFAQRKEIASLAHASDFSIFFIKPSYSKMSSSPTKMGELMAMGIPLICNQIGDVGEIVMTLNAGVCISKTNENQYEGIVSQLKNNLSTFSTSSKTRESSKDFFDLEKGLFLYRSLYKEIIG